MKKKYFIFAFTFLSILTGLQSYGQGIDSGDNVKTIVVKLNIPLGAIDSINKLNPKSFINIDNPKPDTDVEVKLSISNVVTTTSSSNTTSSQTSTSFYSFPIDYSRLQNVPSTSICWICDLDSDSSYTPPTSSITLPNSAVAISNNNKITYGWDNINNFFHIDYVLSSDGNDLSSSTQWYLDQDGDGFDGGTATGSTKPAGDGWVLGNSRGTDCDDTKWSYDNIDCSEKKTWYLDEDNDGWYSQVQQAELNPGTGWKEAPVSGIDCNDAKHSLTNDCSIADPCAEIKNVVNYKRRYPGTDLKTNINYLKGVVDRGETNKKEEGYVTRKIMNLDGTYNLRSDVLPTGSQEKLPLKSGGYIVGTFHSHTYKGDSMYSFGDLKHLLNLYDKALPSNKRDIFEGMVARDPQDNNNVYMLKVDDIEKLRDHIEAVEDSEKYSNLNPDDRLEKIHEEQALLYHKSNGQKEKSFLQQFPNAGISLYKANTDVSNFSKLTLNNDDDVILTPCN